MFGDWVSANASGSGYKVEVNNNIFANTKKEIILGQLQTMPLQTCSENTKLRFLAAGKFITGQITCRPVRKTQSYASGNRFWDNKYVATYKVET